MAYRNRKFWIHIGVLCLLPLLVLITVLVLHISRGPNWLGANFDPEYPYLFNSLNILELKEIGDVDHPGTPTQMLGAIVIKIAYLITASSEDDLPIAVLKNPEFYLRMINAVIIVINVLLLGIVGLAALLLSKNIWLSVLLQFSPFLSTTILTELTRVSPEPLLLFASLLIILMMIRHLEAESVGGIWEVIGFALIFGFGMAVKIIFVQLLIIPVIILPTLRKKVGFLAGTGISFVIFTLPILSKYHFFLEWVYRLFLHTELYGEGEAKIIDGKLYLQSLQQLFWGNPLFFLILFFMTGVLLKMMFSTRLRQHGSIWANTYYRVFFAVVMSQLFGILMVAKHSHNRYLLPVLSLSGFSLFLFLMFSKYMPSFRIFTTKKGIICIGIFFALSSFVRIIDIRQVYIDNNTSKNEMFDVYKKAESTYKDYIKIRYYRSSSPQYALSFGNDFSQSQHSKELQKLYGEAYFYNRWLGKFHTWTREFFIEELIGKEYDGKVLLQGSPIFRGNNNTLISKRTGSTVKLQDILNGKQETIYRIESVFPLKRISFIPE